MVISKNAFKNGSTPKFVSALPKNNGEAAGQTVKHVHFHIVPRYGNSPIVFESHAGDMGQLKALADRIRMA